MTDDTKRTDRTVDLTIDIDATLEEVWQALTTGEGIARWFAPYAAVTPGEGGSASIGWRMNADTLRPLSSPRNSGRTPLPSSGGSGSRLKTNRMRLSEKVMLSTIASPAKELPSAATVTWVKSTVMGAKNTPAATPTVFGDGLLCLVTPIVRMAASTASGGQSLHGLNHGAGPGTFHYQLWYRNSADNFCTPARFNLSSGYTIVFP